MICAVTIGFAAALQVVERLVTGRLGAGIESAARHRLDAASGPDAGDTKSRQGVDPSEDRELQKLISENTPIEVIASRLGRTPGAARGHVNNRGRGSGVVNQGN